MRAWPGEKSGGWEDSLNREDKSGKKTLGSVPYAKIEI
jgi:hypothetical protein